MTPPRDIPDSERAGRCPGAPVQPVPPDGELIRRTLAGDRDAFGDLALRYEAGLFGHLRRLTGNRDDAEDLAQEALLRAYRKLPGLEPSAPFAPWLFRIATNLALDTLRRRGKLRFESTDQLAELPDTQAAPVAERLDAAQLSRRLGAAVEQLPPLLATILNLYYHEQMKLPQIADIVQRDARTIAVAMHRARLRLRDILTRPASEGDLGK